MVADVTAAWKLWSILILLCDISRLLRWWLCTCIYSCGKLLFPGIMFLLQFKWVSVIFLKCNTDIQWSFSFPRSTSNLWDFHCITPQNLLCPNSAGFSFAAFQLREIHALVWCNSYTTEILKVLGWTRETKMASILLVLNEMSTT